MTAKGTFLFLLLLLCSSASFPYSNLPFPADEEHSLMFDQEFEEELAELYDGNFPSLRSGLAKADLFPGKKDFVLESSYITRSGFDLFKRCSQIVPGLTTAEIIFPFHDFI